MTKEQLLEKVNSCLENDKEFINKLVSKAIASGCMDIEGAENNYILTKNLLSAIYRHMSFEYRPLSKDKTQQKNIDNIYTHL